MSYFGMFCQNACNTIIYVYNNYSNVQEWRYLLNFFGVLGNQDFTEERRNGK